jgi:hypothetical protein
MVRRRKLKWQQREAATVVRAAASAENYQQE